MKLLVDGVEIKWPKRIEVQVAPEGEVAGPLWIEFSGGQLVIQGNAERPNGITMTNMNWGWKNLSQAFVKLLGHGQAFGDEFYMKRTTVDQLPRPDVIAGGTE